MTSLGRAPQLMAINGLSALSLLRWIILATTSLPVPLSPLMSTAVGDFATRWMADRISSMTGLLPTRMVLGSSPFSCLVDSGDSGGRTFPTFVFISHLHLSFARNTH